MIALALVLACMFSFSAAALLLGGASLRPSDAMSIGAARAWVGGLAPVAAYLDHERLLGRRRECLVQLPVLLDVLTLGLSAGLSFDASLELYCERYETELARELSDAMASWRMGLLTRSEALAQLAKRLDIDALRRFAAAVSEALAFGSPLADVLEHQAQAIRDEHRSRVEEQIDKVPVKMLIPLGTLIVPAMLLAILGPLMGPALKSV